MKQENTSEKEEEKTGTDIVIYQHSTPEEGRGVWILSWEQWLIVL